MWNARRSLMLSKVAVVLFMVALAAALVFSPVLAQWMADTPMQPLIELPGRATTPFLCTMYVGAVPAGYLLVCLLRLLMNIGKEQVFIAQNVSMLRRISWCCMAGAILCLASALYCLPWLMVSAAAAFVGLIVRVVKNVMAQAVALKEESDFTI